MDIKKILRFVRQCKDMLKREPGQNEVHKKYLFTRDGMAYYLQMCGSNDFRIGPRWYLHTTVEGYKLDHCDHCTGTNPCGRHQECNTLPLNNKTIIDAKRANDPEIGLRVPVPEPVYPRPARAFNSLEEFREATKEIFPQFRPSAGWTFPDLPEGLTWEFQQVSKEKDRNYPHIIGYSEDGKRQYERGFYLCGEGDVFLLNHLDEQLPKLKNGRILRAMLIRSLKALKALYRLYCDKCGRERDRIERQAKQATLAEERAKLAKEFNVSLP